MKYMYLIKCGWIFKTAAKKHKISNVAQFYQLINFQLLVKHKFDNLSRNLGNSVTFWAQFVII